MKIIVMGMPGSGKSTQAELLAKKLGVPHLQTGDLCRQIAKKKTPFGQKIKEIVSVGGLVSDEDIIKILTQNLAQKEKYQDGYVLDGFPRTIFQAQHFDQSLDTVIYLSLEDQEGGKRLLKRATLENRQDDTLETIKTRLELYRKNTKPILDYYRQKGILHKINGRPSIEEIHLDILSKLGLLVKQ